MGFVGGCGYAAADQPPGGATAAADRHPTRRTARSARWAVGGDGGEREGSGATPAAARAAGRAAGQLTARPPRVGITGCGGRDEEQEQRCPIKITPPSWRTKARPTRTTSGTTRAWTPTSRGWRTVGPAVTPTMMTT